MNWIQVELKDVAVYGTDRIETTLLNNGNYISTENMLPEKAGVIESSYPPSTNNVTAFSTNDILVSNIRPYFKKIWFAKNDGGCSNDVIVFKSIEDKINSKFLYFQLSKDDFFDYMMSGANGTKMPRGNRKAIPYFKLLIPKSIATQQKISSILSAYDDLIENNLKRIKLLEEAAQHIYKEWFVNFRFPDYENVAFENGLPKGWEKKRLDEVLTFKTGKLDSNAAVEKGAYPFFTCSQEIFKTNTYSFDTEAVLLGGNNASGIYPLKYFNGKFDAYQRTYIIKPKEATISHKYVFLYFYNSLDYLKNISTGAATKFLTLRILNQLEIVLPDKTMNEEFERVINPFFLQIRTLTDYTEKLKEARDILLPRLMNRTIEV